MKRTVAYILLLTVLAASGRIIQVLPVKTLVAQSKLVFVGRVKSVRPSGITTSLTYPTWEGAIFEWLKVDVEVLEPIKGTTRGQRVQTAMLSLKQNAEGILSPGMYCPPGMVEPKKDEALLLFLLPTPRTNLFAALTAPYDDNRSIFRLDRKCPEYRAYAERKQKEESPYDDPCRLVWSLVDDRGQIMSGGAETMRKVYASEVAMVPTNRLVYLEWQKFTNPFGWSGDIPKGSGYGTTTNRN